MHQLGKTPIQESLKISLLWKQRCSRFVWRLNWKISEHREKIWHSNQWYCLQYFIDPLQQQYFKSLRLSRRWGSWLQCNSWTPSMLQLQGYYTHKKKSLGARGTIAIGQTMRREPILWVWERLLPARRGHSKGGTLQQTISRSGNRRETYT